MRYSKVLVILLIILLFTTLLILIYSTNLFLSTSKALPEQCENCSNSETRLQPLGNTSYINKNTNTFINRNNIKKAPEGKVIDLYLNKKSGPNQADRLEELNSNLNNIYKWIGNDDTSWLNKDNWDRGSVPTDADSVILESEEEITIDLVDDLHLNELLIGENIVLKANGFAIRVDNDFNNFGVLELLAVESIVLPKGLKQTSGTIRYLNNNIHSLPFGYDNYYNIEFDLGENEMILDNKLTAINDIIFKSGNLNADYLELLSLQGNIVLGKGNVKKAKLYAQNGNILGNNNIDDYLQVSELDIVANNYAGKIDQPVRLQAVDILFIDAMQGIFFNHQGDVIFNNEKWNLNSQGAVNINAM